MRLGAETEAWDRLAFLVAHCMGAAGKKNPKIEDYHKFMQNSTTLTAKKLKSMKGMFPNGETKG